MTSVAVLALASGLLGGNTAAGWSSPDGPVAEGIVLPQGGTYQFEHLTIEDGLSQNAGLALLQDRSGYLWIGTQDGLNRYDGYSFTVFKHDPEDPNSLSYNSVVALLEDADGRLWIGTWGGGLNQYDPDTGRFTRYSPDPADPAALSHALVTTLLQDSSGAIWVGTLGGLDRFEPDTGGFTHFRHDPDNPISLSSDAVSTLFEDSSHALWIGTGAFGTPGAGLNRFDPTTGGFTRFSNDPADPASLAGDNVAAIVEANDGRLWVGLGGFSLAGAGLDLLDPETGTAEHHRHNPDDPASLSADDVFSLLISDDGQLWVGTWSGGLNQMALDAPGRFTRYEPDPYRPHSLGGEEVWSLLQDRSGVIWAGSAHNGLSKLTPHSREFLIFEHRPDVADGLAGNEVGAFAEDAQGGLWIGTWGSGLEHVDPLTGRFTHYRHDPDRADTLSSDMIMSLHVDAQGAVWMGTLGGGIDRLDPTTGVVERHPPDPADPAALIDGSVTTIVSDSAGRLWVATLGGLHRLDPGSNAFVRYVADPARADSLHYDQIVSLLPATDGTLWIGTWGGGLDRLDLTDPASLDPARAAFTHYGTDTGLSDDNVWAILRADDGALWLGTQGGLNRLDPATGDVRVYREADGLRNATVLGLMAGSDNDLWMTTNNGLARLDIESHGFVIYDTTDGLASNEFNSNAWLRTRAGLMLVGTGHGFNVFDPADLAPQGIAPTVVLTDFQVFNESVPHAAGTPITLAYDQNFVAFEFAALDFAAPDRNVYAYKLEGYDDDWIQAGTRRYASYTNLPGRDYTLRVRAANADGVWSRDDLAIPLTITPPFWDTLWFRGLVVALLIGAVAGGVQLRLNGIRARNRELERVVQQRTTELEASTTLLQKKAAQEAVANERTRLARDLHDAVTQTLFAATLIAEVLPDLWPADPVAGSRRLEELRQLTRGALAEMRMLLVELRPNALTEVPLPTLLRQLTEAVSGRSRLAVEFGVDGERTLPPEVQLALYRIAQEALNNIVKHAHAAQAVVKLRLGPTVRLTIADSGTGFDPAMVTADHLGLKIMRERAEAVGARLTLSSEPGDGTQVTVVWEGER